MTRVVEGGQLEWTFEELNLMEEFILVSEEFVNLGGFVMTACDLMDKYNGHENSLIWNTLALEVDIARKRRELMLKVKWSIFNYMTQEEKNECLKLK